MSFIEGAALDLLEHRDRPHDRLRALIVSALPGALAAAAQRSPRLASKLVARSRRHSHRLKATTGIEPV